MPSITVIAVTMVDRDDGGLEVYSDDLEGLILSGSNRAKVVAAIIPAIEALLNVNQSRSSTV